MARRRPPSRRRRLGKTAGTSPKYSRWTRRWPYPAAGGEGEIIRICYPQTVGCAEVKLASESLGSNALISGYMDYS